MSANYKIAETETFSKKAAKPEFVQVYKKLIKYVYPQLKENPYFGTNIKKLKGEYEGIFRYRIGNNRVFYIIEEKIKKIYILEIQKRKDSYR